MIKRPKFNIVRKTDISIVFELIDETGATFDLSGYVAKFATKQNITDSSTLTSDAGTIDITNGKITVVVSGASLPTPTSEKPIPVYGELVLWSNGDNTTTPSHRIQFVVLVNKQIL